MNQHPAVVAARPVARSVQRMALVLAGVLMVAFAVVLGAAGGASAHDELSSSTPEPGATLETVPEAIELAFTNVPATIGSEIQVLDETGEDWAEGDVSITDAVATQALREGAPAGTYTVNWRVVSSDSHPIEGTFEFTASDGSAVSETPDASGTPEASVGTGGPVEPAEAGALDPDPTAGFDVSWGVILMIAVLIAITIVLGIGARRRLKQGSSEAP